MEEASNSQVPFSGDEYKFWGNWAKQNNISRKALLFYYSVQFYSIFGPISSKKKIFTESLLRLAQYLAMVVVE